MFASYVNKILMPVLIQNLITSGITGNFLWGRNKNNTLHLVSLRPKLPLLFYEAKLPYSNRNRPF